MHANSMSHSECESLHVLNATLIKVLFDEETLGYCFSDFCNSSMSKHLNKIIVAIVTVLPLLLIYCF